MNATIVALSVTLILMGCGEAVSINAQERKAEDVRREAARDADDADTVRVRDAANEAYAGDRDAAAAVAEEPPLKSDL